MSIGKCIYENGIKYSIVTSMVPGSCPENWGSHAVHMRPLICTKNYHRMEFGLWRIITPSHISCEANLSSILYLIKTNSKNSHQLNLHIGRFFSGFRSRFLPWRILQCWISTSNDIPSECSELINAHRTSRLDNRFYWPVHNGIIYNSCVSLKLMSGIHAVMVTIINFSWESISTKLTLEGVRDTERSFIMIANNRKRVPEEIPGKSGAWN